MKKLNKRILTLLIALVFVLSACQAPAENTDKSNETTSSVSSAKVESTTAEITSTEESKAEASGISFKDSLGKEFNFDKPLTKVIILNRQTAEAMKIIGAEDVVIATGDRTTKFNSYLGFNDLPDMGKTQELNIEAIIELEPEAVFCFTNRAMELEAQLEPAGISVIRIDNYQPEKYDEELRLLAKIFNKEDRAEEFLKYRHNLQDEIAKRVATLSDEAKPTVMALSAGALKNGNYNIFPVMNTEDNPGVGEGYATILAGGKDATPSVKYDVTKTSTSVKVESEFALEANPEAMTLHGIHLGGYDKKNTDFLDKEWEEIKAKSLSTLSQTKAFQDGKVYFFHNDYLGASKRPLGLIQLGKYLHPDLFADMDTEAYSKEYFEKWLGVPYQGIWYYAPIK